MRVPAVMVMRQAPDMSNATDIQVTPRQAASSRPLVVVGAAGALLLPVSAGAALLAGVALGLTVGNPWARRTPRIAQRLLAASVVALGAGMDLRVVARVGVNGLGYTAAGITLALVLGSWLGRRLGVARDTSLLLSVGTAICGGSAIAAVAPVIGAKARDVSAAIIAVFVLNAVALFLFPAIGHALHLSQRAFGLWAALAIHDTSSVVGAAAAYGREALDVATAAKLARALWIVPVALGVAAIRARAKGTTTQARPKRPWFIAGFLLAAALVTYLPALRPAGHLVASAAHRMLALTLFLIGLGLSREGLRELGIRPLVLAIALWVVLASASLGAIRIGLIG
jgi:uncharacterized integral membrane protein (TIGR00698 family)